MKHCHAIGMHFIYHAHRKPCKGWDSPSGFPDHHHTVEHLQSQDKKGATK